VVAVVAVVAVGAVGAGFFAIFVFGFGMSG